MGRLTTRWVTVRTTVYSVTSPPLLGWLLHLKTEIYVLQNKPGSPPIEGEGLLLKKEWKSFFFFSEMHIKMLHTAAPLEMEKNIIQKIKMLKNIDDSSRMG